MYLSKPFKMSPRGSFDINMFLIFKMSGSYPKVGGGSIYQKHLQLKKSLNFQGGPNENCPNKFPEV